MKVQNVSDELIIIAGVKIYPNEIKDLATDFGLDINYMQYKDDFLDYFNIGYFIFLNDDGNIITNVDVIIAYFISTDDSNEAEELFGNIYSDSIYYLSNNNFYYNFKTINLDFDEVKEIKFEGYLKTLDILAKTGDIEIQIIDPLMNKINVNETNNYVIDADYKLFNPTIRITGLKKAEVSIYLDGNYYNETKTKEQYLQEIYSNDEFPRAGTLEHKELMFKVNFKKTISSDSFYDIVYNKEGKTYNNSYLKSFNLFKSNAYVKFYNINPIWEAKNYTFSLWFNLLDDISSKQTLYYQKNMLEITVENSNITIYIGDKHVYIENVKNNNWELLTITKTDTKWSFYLGETLIFTEILNPRFLKWSTYKTTYIGTKAGYNYISSGYIGECLIYNYHFSNGMIKYLYRNNHPDTQIQTNLISGSYLTKYKNNSAIIPNELYEFNLIQKENAIISNLKSSNRINTIQYTGTDLEELDLTILTGIIHIPSDDKFTFKFEGDGKFNFSINDKNILTNILENRVFIEEGYYRFKLICMSKDFKITYSTDDETFQDLEIYIEDFNDEATDDTLKVTKFFDFSNRISEFDLIFDDINTDGYFDSDTYSIIDTLSSEINNRLFNIHFDLNLLESDALILAQADNLSITVSNNVLIFKKHNTELISNKLELNTLYNIQITSNGASVFLYINGELVNQTELEIDISLDSLNPMYIGSKKDGIIDNRTKGKFNITDFIWYLKYFSEDEIINTYIK